MFVAAIAAKQSAVPSIPVTEEDVPVQYVAVDLGTLGGRESQAVAVNDRGQMVGWSRTADDKTHAFLWTESRGMIDLGTLGGGRSQAKDVNDRGQVVGGSQTASGGYHAVLWQVTKQGEGVPR